jgi:predicted Zn finger-like uncharacterized protein
MEDISRMKTQCPKCKASGKIDDSKIPEKGVYVRCPKCNERFYLEQELRFELEESQEIKFGDSNANSSKKEKRETKEVEPRDNKNYSTDKNEDKHPTEINEDISDKKNTRKLKVIVLSTACVLIVATLLYVVFGLMKKQDSNEARVQQNNQVTKTSMLSSQARLSLEKELKVAGEVITKTVTTTSGLSKTTYYLSQIDISLDNKTPFNIILGKQLIFYESDKTFSIVYGSIVVYGLKPIEYKEQLKKEDIRFKYYLPDYEMRYLDGSICRKMRFTHSAASFMAVLTLMSQNDDQKNDRIPFSLDKDKISVFHMNVLQSSWATDNNETSKLRIALPELQIRTKKGIENFRLIVFFKKQVANDLSKNENKWIPDSQMLVSLDKAELMKTLESPKTDLLTQILILNWLVDLYPAYAGPIIIDIAQKSHDEKMLNVCLVLLESLNNDEFKEYAEAIYKAPDTSLITRFFAVDYLLTIGHTPDLKTLIDIAIDKDAEARRLIISMLGRMGLPQSKDALTTLLKNESIMSSHRQIRSNLKKYENK